MGHSSKKIAFRVDSSKWIGSGHAVRCATLGRALARSGFEVHMVSREMPGNAFRYFREQGFELHPLPRVDAPCQKGDLEHSAWLGVDQESDLRESEEILSSLGGVDWLVTDHYALDHHWQEPIREFAHRILAIDDFADRKLDADLLLDQNFFTNAEARYQGLLPPACKMMLGPRYALLKEDFQELALEVQARERGEIERILVSFGGFDEADLTSQWVETFIAVGRNGVKADVVISKTHHSWEKLNKLAEAHAGLELHSDLPSLGPLMSKADLAFGAGGTTTWERCCLGLPSVVISLAQNQVPIASALEETGIVNYLGHHDSVSSMDLKKVLMDQLNLGFNSRMSDASRKLVDGKGAQRIVEVILEQS